MSDDLLKPTYDTDTFGFLLGMLSHDLRNPTATVVANLSFLQETLSQAVLDDPDVKESLEDLNVGIQDLRFGLDQISWISRYLSGEQAARHSMGDLKVAVEEAVRKVGDLHIEYIFPESPIRVVGGTCLVSLLCIFFMNAKHHAPGKPVVVRVLPQEHEELVVVEIQDAGVAVDPKLRKSIWTIEGQSALKGKAEGRYARVIGWVAARALADSIGARLEADEVDGANMFRIYLKTKEQRFEL